ncbi:MAG TPA: FtsX-like permease family protein [Anaeromyxobacter sp.]|nr:FtsX-like permease family protein [Anaeromyxobacter sp.]
MTWLWFALKNVRRNGRRALLTFLIAAVGTIALLVFGGYGQATYAALAAASARDTGHLVLAHPGFFEGDEDTPMQNGLRDPTALEASLQEDPRVVAALPRLQLTGLLSNGEKSAVFVGTGLDAAGERRVRGDYLALTEGEELSPSPPPADLPEILVGKELARTLHAHPGSVLTLLSTTTEGSLNAQDVKVRGLYTVGVDDLDRRSVLVHLSTAQRLLLTDRVSTLAVYLRSLDEVAPARADLIARHGDLVVRTWLDQAAYYVAVRALYDRIFGLLGIIIVVLVLFAISNTTGMAVVERTREIGTLRSLGAGPGLITRNFVVEGLLVGLGGALLGAAVATAITLLVHALHVQMPPPPGRSTGYPLRFDLTAGLFLRAGTSVALAAATAAWTASRKAAARPIVEALTHV